MNEMSQSTGVLVSFGVNAYYVNPEPSSTFILYIDPSHLNGDAESNIEAYAQRKGLKDIRLLSDEVIPQLRI